ncbi:MAG TPA: hypothetical protein VMT52_20120, partial [Planctomycetota bacterium]|nr:hypothetical protein [Planctomycetota bacterium]
ILGGLFTSGWLNLELPLVSALLLAASHAGHWAGEAPLLRRLRPWQAATVRLLLAAIPAALAIAVANWPREE